MARLSALKFTVPAFVLPLRRQKYSPNPPPDVVPSDMVTVHASGSSASGEAGFAGFHAFNWMLPPTALARIRHLSLATYDPIPVADEVSTNTLPEMRRIFASTTPAVENSRVAVRLFW